MVEVSVRSGDSIEVKQPPISYCTGRMIPTQHIKTNFDTYPPVRPAVANSPHHSDIAFMWRTGCRANVLSRTTNLWIGVVMLFILWVLSTGSAFGQKNITNQSLIWYGYFTTLDINDKWYFQHEFQERHYINPVAQHQFLIRSHIHRRWGQSGWESSLGMCLFLQNPNDPHATTTLTVPELRPHVEMAYKQKLEKLTLDHRYRTEARFFHNTNTSETSLEDGFDFGHFRFRYRLQATFPLFALAEDRFLKIKVSNEIHLNAGHKISKNVFEQNRIYAGINIDISPSLTADIGYLNWFQQRPTGDFFNRNILRFTVFHRV